MTQGHEFSYHLFEEREFQARFFPAVRGEEEIVRELLDAADASGPSWTALHKLFDDTRAAFEVAVREVDGDAAQRTIFAAFAQFVGHLRPTFCSRAASFSHIDRDAFPELAPFLRSPGALLRSGRAALDGIPAGLPDRVPATCLEGRSGGAVVLSEDVRPCVEALRAVMPRLAEWLAARGHDPAETLTVMLSALVEAKLRGSAVLEGCDVLEGDAHLPKEHRRSFQAPESLPPAVVREVARVLGQEPPLPEPEAEEPAAAAPEPTEVIPYTPQGVYEVGQLLHHKAFGTGEVTRILDSRRLQARFDGQGEKTLVQGLAPREDASRDNGADVANAT